MSADILRQAASLMRSRAKAAICPCGGPVCTVEKGWFREGELRERLGDGLDDRDPRITSGDSVPHVLAWSPAVALAVADWLDYTAQTWRSRPLREKGAVFGGDQEQALTVARAYLGSDQ